MSLIIRVTDPNNNWIALGADSRWISTQLDEKKKKWVIFDIGDDAQKIFRVAENIAVTTNGSTGFSYVPEEMPDSGVDVDSMLWDFARIHRRLNITKFIAELREAVNGEIDFEKELKILERKMVEALEEENEKVVSIQRVQKRNCPALEVCYRNKEKEKKIWEQKPDIDFTLSVNGYRYDSKDNALPVVVKLNFPENEVRDMSDTAYDCEAHGSMYIKEFSESDFAIPIDSELFGNILPLWERKSDANNWISTVLFKLTRSIEKLHKGKFKTPREAADVIREIISEVALLEGSGFKLKKRCKGKYGSAPYVGGPIDILRIHPKRGSDWLTVKHEISERENN